MPQPLRICGVVSAFCHPTWQGSGIVRTATNLLEGLARRGNFVTVISPLTDLDRRFELPSQTSFHDGHLRLLYSPTSYTRRFVGASSDGLAELLTPLLPAADIVHIHSFLSPWTDVAATMAYRAGVPYVIQDHGKLTPSLMGKLKWAYYYLRARKILRRAACVVPSATNVAEYWRRRDPRMRVEACTNGLDPAEFESPAPPRPIAEPYILYLGYLDPRKNPDLLIRAFAKAADRIKPWKLALVGPDSYGLGNTLPALAAQLGVGERVVLPGRVDPQGRLAWLKNAGLSVMASAGEGLSLAMLEAIACGLPSLLSPGCNYPEIEEHRAGQVLELRDDLWADAFVQWINDDARRRAAGENARRLFLTHHTIDAVCAQLEDLLRRAIEPANATRPGTPASSPAR